MTAGDLRKELCRMALGQESIKDAPASLVVTGVVVGAFEDAGVRRILIVPVGKK